MVSEPACMLTPSRTYARVLAADWAVGRMIGAAPRPPAFTESPTAGAVIVEPPLTFTSPLPTLTDGTWSVAAFSARSPISASTTPVISASDLTPTTLPKSPMLIGLEVAVARYGACASTVRLDVATVPFTCARVPPTILAVGIDTVMETRPPPPTSESAVAVSLFSALTSTAQEHVTEPVAPTFASVLPSISARVPEPYAFKEPIEKTDECPFDV